MVPFQYDGCESGRLGSTIDWYLLYSLAQQLQLKSCTSNIMVSVGVAAVMSKPGAAHLLHPRALPT